MSFQNRTQLVETELANNAEKWQNTVHPGLPWVEIPFAAVKQDGSFEVVFRSRRHDRLIAMILLLIPSATPF